MFAQFQLLPLVNQIQLSLLLITVVSTLYFAFKKRYQGIAGLMLLFSIFLFMRFAQEQGVLQLNQYFGPLMLTIGPFCYLAVCDLVYQHTMGKLFNTLHFLPAIVAAFLADTIDGVNLLSYVSLLGYCILSVRLIRKYHLAAFSCQADAETCQINWLYHGLAFLLVSFILETVRLTLGPQLPREILNMFYLVNILVTAIGILLIVFMASVKRDLFAGLEDYESWAEADVIKVDSEYREHAQSLFKQIESLLRNEKCYLNSALSLSDIELKTGSSQRDISWAVYQGSGCNFCDFVNEFRIEMVKDKIAEIPVSGRTLTDLALSCGFRSRKSFTQVFRRFTGMLPKQYSARLK